MYALAARLRRENFESRITGRLRDFVKSAKEHTPDVMIIRISSQPRDVATTLHFLSRSDINFYTIPAFLIVQSSAIRRLTPLLKMGLEDILDLRCELDFLILKIKKVRERLASGKACTDDAAHQAESRGNLSDMNLIDLLQALGPSRRTVRIEVTPDGEEERRLILFLHQGNIIFAKLGDLTGEHAVFEALGWQTGAWVSKPIAEKDLPEANNHLPNEAILMEGCRQLDERAKAAPVS